MRKLNTLAEKLRALADGEKIRDTGWDDDEFIQIKDDIIVDETGVEALDYDFIYESYEIYEAPKDENLYEWMTKDANSDYDWFVCARLYTKEKATLVFSGEFDYAIKSGPYNPRDFKKE